MSLQHHFFIAGRTGGRWQGPSSSEFKLSCCCARHWPEGVLTIKLYEPLRLAPLLCCTSRRHCFKEMRAAIPGVIEGNTALA